MKKSPWEPEDDPVTKDEALTTYATAIFYDDDGGVTGFIEEFLSVTAHGKDLAEARVKLKAAAKEFLQRNNKSVSERLSAYGAVLRERLTIHYTTDQ